LLPKHHIEVHQKLWKNYQDLSGQWLASKESVYQLQKQDG